MMKKVKYRFTVVLSDVNISQKSFSVILILVVMFTVVIFGQIHSKKNVTFTVLAIPFTVLGTFGHLTRWFLVFIPSS